MTQLLDYEQGAQILGCSPRMVRKLVQTRQIASVKVGALVRLESSAIEDYVNRNRRQAT